MESLLGPNNKDVRECVEEGTSVGGLSAATIAGLPSLALPLASHLSPPLSALQRVRRRSVEGASHDPGSSSAYVMPPGRLPPPPSVRVASSRRDSAVVDGEGAADDDGIDASPHSVLPETGYSGGGGGGLNGGAAVAGRWSCAPISDLSVGPLTWQGLQRCPVESSIHPDHYLRLYHPGLAPLGEVGGSALDGLC